MEFSASATYAAVFYLLVLIPAFSRSDYAAPLNGSDLVVNAIPTVLGASVVSRDVVRCARVNVSGLSRLKLGSYSSAHKIALVPSDEIHEKSYRKIQICLHSNASLGLCKCHNDDWEGIQSGIWNSVVSPYEDRYIDVKFVENLAGSVNVSITLEFHKWRLLCLAIGFVILLLAPIVSSWVPFYYSSSMAIGVCLVVLIILFQGMKLLPTGRKSALYSTLCGLALGAGSFLLNRFSVFVNSILANLGISEEMHNPVLVFLLVGIVLAGAGFGYWLVRKFVVDEDGSVDVGVAQFVKWALRVIAVTFIFQSTLDTPLAAALFVSLLGIYFSLTSLRWYGLGIGNFMYSGVGNTPKWHNLRDYRKDRNKHAEFHSRSGTPTARSRGDSARSRGVVTPTSLRHHMSSSPQDYCSTPPTFSGSTSDRDFPSTFHTTPNRKKYSKEEWKRFTDESTQQAIAGWASSPEVSDWLFKQAYRIQLRPEGSSDDESIGSGSDSTDENAPAQSSSLLWRRRR